MRKFKALMLGICAAALCACTSQQSTAVQMNERGTRWSWDKGTIVVETPERPEGQKSVIGLTVPKMEVVRVGFVGLGMRGPGAVERFTYIPGTQIVALCDYEKERAEKCQKYLEKASLPKAAIYSGEKDTKSFANARTSTLCILQPTGCITSRLPNVRWKMERM